MTASAAARAVDSSGWPAAAAGWAAGSSGWLKPAASAFSALVSSLGIIHTVLPAPWASSGRVRRYW